jgi:hypothetical protein
MPKRIARTRDQGAEQGLPAWYWQWADLAGSAQEHESRVRLAEYLDGKAATLAAALAKL